MKIATIFDELNPRNGSCADSFYKWFDGFLKDDSVVWEPFASHCNHRTGKLMPKKKIIAYSISSNDNLVARKDSAIEYPEIKVDGVFFHPPYFGSSFTSHDNDIANFDFGKWHTAICSCIKNIDKVLKDDGMICVVGGIYRKNSIEWNMNTVFCDLFNFTFDEKQVSFCPPDIATIYKRRK